MIDAERPERTITWQQYYSMVQRLAAGLQASGLAKSECVALMSRNDVCYYILADAVILAGGVFIGLPPDSKLVELEGHVKAADVKWIFAEPRLLQQAQSAFTSLGLLESHVFLFDAANPAGGSRQSFSSLLQTEGPSSKEQFDSAHGGDQACFRFLTSGSTGTPKAAEISHACSIARVQQSNKVIPGSDIRQLQIIAMYHATGVLTHVRAVTGHVVAYISAKPEAALSIDYIEKYSVTDMTLHPRFAEDLAEVVRSGARKKEALKSFRRARIGGSLCRNDTVQAFRSVMPDDVVVAVSYGSTEAWTLSGLTGGMTYVPDHVGGRLPGTEVIIVDPETLQEVPADIDGEVFARGPLVFSGYVNNPEANKATFVERKDGVWFRTGDKGHFSSKYHQLRITGRYKEIFKVGSEEVAPSEVEAELLKHPALTDATVTCTDGRRKKGDLEVLAYVVSKDDQLSAQDIVDFVASRVSAWKAPTGGVTFCDRIPRTAYGKIDRKALANEKIQERSAKHLSIGV